MVLLGNRTRCWERYRALVGTVLQISLLIDQFDKLFYNYLLHIPILFTY